MPNQLKFRTGDRVVLVQPHRYNGMAFIDETWVGRKGVITHAPGRSGRGYIRVSWDEQPTSESEGSNEGSTVSHVDEDCLDYEIIPATDEEIAATLASISSAIKEDR